MAAEGRAMMIAPGEGEVVLQGGIGVVHKISAAATGGAFSVVEHSLQPGHSLPRRTRTRPRTSTRS